MQISVLPIIINRVSISRRYCVSAVKTVVSQKFDILQLNHISKVPDQPAKECSPSAHEAEIDKRTIQVLERLSLVNLDGEVALATLSKSIEFAKRIECIAIGIKQPLYTVLETEHLRLREDTIIEGNYKGEILKNAKIIEEDYFISPPGNIPLNQDESYIKH